MYTLDNMKSIVKEKEKKKNHKPLNAPPPPDHHYFHSEYLLFSFSPSLFSFAANPLTQAGNGVSCTDADRLTEPLPSLHPIALGAL